MDYYDLMPNPATTLACLALALAALPGCAPLATSAADPAITTASAAAPAAAAKPPPPKPAPPAQSALTARLKACRALGADVVKIVTLATRAEDNLRVLALLPQAREMGQDLVAFCMGEQGRLSRVAAPLLGSRWSYASLEKGASSAPGQFTAAEMRTILGMLHS